MSERRDPDPSGTIRPTPAVAVGTLIDGRYRVQAQLGAGGMGEVHRALDEQTGEVVALKLLRSDLRSDAGLAGLADGEARTGWYLNRRGIIHPNIVRTLQIGRWRPPGGDRELPYLVMEYVAGPTLGEWMKGYGDRLPDPARVFALVEQIAAGLAAAHDAGLLHRDLKPSNVLIDGATGTPKITDFGISIAVAGPDPTRARGRELATPAWAAPEQLDPASRSPEGLHTDVYSLGKILYYLLSGRFYDPQLYRPGGGSRRLPRQIDDLIRRACAQNPEDRFADVPAFLAAFRAVVKRYARLRGAGSGKLQADPDRPRRFLKVTALYTLLGAPFFLAILLGTRYLATEELAFRVRSDDVLTLPLVALGVAWLVYLPQVLALSRGSGGRLPARLRGVVWQAVLCAALVAGAVSPWIFRRFTEPDFFTAAVWDGLIWFLLWGFLFYGFQALLLSSLGVKIPPQWTILSVAALCLSLAVAEPLRIAGTPTPLQIALFGLLQGALVGSVQWWFLRRRLSPSWPWLVTTSAGTCVLWLFGLGDLGNLAISVTALHFVQALCLAVFGSSRTEPGHRRRKQVRAACDPAPLAPSGVDTVPSSGHPWAG